MSQKFLSEINLQALNNATTDTDKFLVSDSGVVKYRTGAEVLSDIGAAPASGSGNYIQNQISSAQSANMWISGNAIVGGSISIGTTSQAMPLQVKKDQTSDTAIVVSNAGTAGSTTTMSFVLQEVDTPQGWFRRYRDGSGLNEIGFSTNLAFSGSVTGTKSERMRITSAGNVGIGTTSPAYKLHVVGEGYFSSNLSANNIYATQVCNTSTCNNASLALTSSGVRASRNVADSNTAFTVTQTNASSTGAIQTWNNSAGEVARVAQNGNVGIGTTSPSQKLSVSGNVSISNNNSLLLLDTAGNPGFQIRSTSSNIALIHQANNGSLRYRAGFSSNSGNAHIFAVGADTEIVRFTNDGNVGIGTSSPSEKLVIGSLGGGVKRIYVPGTYNFDGSYLSNYDGNGGGKLELVAHTGVSNSASWRIANNNDTYGQSLTFSYATNTTSYSGLSYSAPAMLIANTGNVGIGTTSPGAKLDVAGDALINGLTVGTGPGNDTSNTVLGENAFASNSSAIRNVAIGASALSSLTINGKNVAIGFAALGSTQETDFSIAIGSRCADAVSGNVRGLTAIGTYMSYDPSQATELGNNCLAISQYDNTTPGLPHFYAPAKIVCPNGNTVTDVLSFDYTLYTAVFMDYSIYNDSGDQFRAGTYTIAMKITGTDVTNDDQTVVYSGTTLSATFIVSISGNIATIQIRNQDSDNYNFRFTSRLLMR